MTGTIRRTLWADAKAPWTDKSPWTDANDKKLRQLWPDPKISAAKIAAEIGCGLSKSSVCGKAWRLGLGVKPRPKAVPKPNPKKTRTPKRDYASAWMKPEPFIPRAAKLQSFNLTILEVRADQCKYIAGDDRLCCGHPVQPGHSWCAAHCKIVYNPRVDRSEKQKIQDMRLGRKSYRAVV